MKEGGGGLRGVERERRVCVCDRERERERFCIRVCPHPSAPPRMEGRRGGGGD